MRGPAGFDRVAGYYDGLARFVFGKSIFRAQQRWLGHVPQNARILVLGGGTGWWLSELLQMNPGCTLLFVEPSGGMLERAKQRVARDAPVRFLQGTAESIADEAQFDAVITFFVLDIFLTPELEHFIDQVKSMVRKDVLWLVSDFVERRWWHGVLLFVMYRFFGVATNLKTHRLPHWERILSESGFEVREQLMLYGDFIKSAVYEVPKCR